MGPLLWVQSLTPCFAYIISSNAPSNRQMLISVEIFYGYKVPFPSYWLSVNHHIYPRKSRKMRPREVR